MSDSLYGRIVSAVRKDLDATSEHILRGRCKDYAEYRASVAKREQAEKDLKTIQAEFGRAEE